MASQRNTTPPPSRRGFLAGLAALPLIGGGVTLIGQPSAVAEPVSQDLLLTYADWLHYERRILFAEMAGYDGTLARAMGACFGDRSDGFHFPLNANYREVPQPSTRAALVLSAVGCGWREAA